LSIAASNTERDKREAGLRREIAGLREELRKANLMIHEWTIKYSAALDAKDALLRVLATAIEETRPKPCGTCNCKPKESEHGQQKST
jgi:hypothetical protein